MAQNTLNDLNIAAIEDININLVYRIRKEFLQDNSVDKAIAILNRMVDIPINAVDLDNSDFWPEICDLLTSLLNVVPVRLMLCDHQIVILSLINKSPERFIKVIAYDYFQLNDELIDLFANTALAVLVAMARRVKDVICAESVANFLCHFVHVREVMHELMTQLDSQNDAEERFRVYQVALSAMLLEDFHDFTMIRKIIEKLVAEIRDNQILISITTLEALSEVAAASSSNIEFLDSINLFDRLKTQKFLFLACIRFFGYVTRVDADALNRYSAFVNETFDMTYHFDLLDATRRQLAFDTLAMITLNSKAKEFFSNTRSYDIFKSMNHFGVAITHSPDDLRVRLLSSLRLMMSESKNVYDSKVLRNWFMELGEPFPNVVLHFLRKPFEDVKISALELLETLFRQHLWAFPLFHKVDGFTEHLLDRKHDSAQVLHLKFDVICRIIDADYTEDILDKATLDRLKQYRENGIYFVDEEIQSVEWGAL